MLAGKPRIAVLTSGGDAPGMNAAVRAVVRTTIAAGADAWGIERGFEGLLERSFRPLSLGSVGGILDRGGTFLATSRSARFQTEEGIAEACKILKETEIDGLVVVGGNGSFRGAQRLHECGIKVLGVPGTIDNDVAGTDTCIGFDTTLNTICDATSKVRDTASSHERTFVIEVMGRECGMLALYAGLASGADCILVPEVPWNLDDVCGCIRRGVSRGKKHTIIIVAEGAGHAFGLAEDLSQACSHHVRAVVLGHIQRGGAPSAFDRILASRMGSAAVNALMRGESGKMTALKSADIVTLSLEEGYSCRHPLRQELYDLAMVLAL
ncbi:MAG TPA: 6-phosphofructokinase [Coriobacteriia bacterium]|jgi:6-phosphofructokinase 1